MAVFVKAADLGSFTAAGIALGLSSQMVGKHVRALEDRLGTTLMRRSTRQQSLTDAGRLYYERCRAVLVEAAAADAVVEEVSSAPRGTLRISAPVGFGACRLAPLVNTFLKSYPEMEIVLNLTDRYVDLVNEGYDAVLRLGPIAETAMVARELSLHDQVACAAPSYLQARGRPKTPADLAHHDCLAFVNASGLPYAEWQFMASEGTVHTAHIRSRFQTNDGRVLAAAVAQGGGIVLQPEAVLREHLDKGRLIPVLTDYTAPARPMYLMFSSRRPQPPKLRAFIEYLVASLPRTV